VFSGREQVALQQIPTEAQFTDSFATAFVNSATAGDQTGFNELFKRVEQRVGTQAAASLAARGKVQGQAALVREKRAFAESATGVMTGMRATGAYPDEAITEIGRNIADGNFHLVPEILASTPFDGVSQTDKAKVEFETARTRLAIEKQRLAFTSRQVAALEAAGASGATFYQQGRPGSPDKYGLGPLGSPATSGIGGIAGLGGGGARTASRLNPQQLAAARDVLDKDGKFIPGKEAGLREALEQSFYLDPRHPVELLKPSTEAGQLVGRGKLTLQEVTSHSEMLLRYSILDGRGLAQALSQRKGTPLTAEQVMRDPELLAEAVEMQREAAQWFRQTFDVPVQEVALPNGASDFELGLADPSAPTNRLQEIQGGFVNEILTHLHNRYDKHVARGGADPFAVVSEDQREAAQARAAEAAAQEGGGARAAGEAAGQFLESLPGAVGALFGGAAGAAAEAGRAGAEFLEGAAGVKPGAARRAAGRQLEEAAADAARKRARARKVLEAARPERAGESVFELGPAQEEFLRRARGQ
jgi:hypothetical protein